MEKLIEGIEAQIQGCKDLGENLDECSWEYEQGIILSANEAQKLLDNIRGRVQPEVIVNFAEEYNKGLQEGIDYCQRQIDFLHKIYTDNMQALDASQKYIDVKNYLKSKISK